MIFQAFRSIQQPWMSVLWQVSLVEHIKWQSSWGKFNLGRLFIFWGRNWAACWRWGLHNCLIATSFQVRFLLRLPWYGDFPCDLPFWPGLETPKILKTTTMPPQLHSDHRGSNQLLSLPSAALLQNPNHLHKCKTASHHALCPCLSSSFVYELISSVSVTPLLEVSLEL